VIHSTPTWACSSGDSGQPLSRLGHTDDALQHSPTERVIAPEDNRGDTSRKE
jgi:hypothetical protein